MSATLNESGWFGKLEDFTHSQKLQMSHWLHYEHNAISDPGIIRSAEMVVNRANQGSSFWVAETTIKGLVDDLTGIVSTRSDDECVAAKMLVALGQCNALDNHFFYYLDGSITVGYDQTGFMLDMDDHSVIIHPNTRMSFQLPEKSYDLSYGQKKPITGRTLFFYRLVQACKEIIKHKEQTK